MAEPGDGEIYLATDSQWYRWPNATPYPSREAAEARDTWAVVASPISSAGAHPPAWYPAPPKPSTGVARATAYLAVLFVGVPAVGGAIGWLVLPHSVDHGCEGIGFGCSPTPADTALFAGFIALFFTVPGVGLAALLMWGLTSAWPWYRELKALPKVGALFAILGAPLLLIRVVGLVYYALVG